jgi:hypothetical protein
MTGMDRQRLAAAIRTWFEDEQERQGYNIPDSYYDWIDTEALADAVLGFLGLHEEEGADFTFGGRVRLVTNWHDET